MVFFDSRLVTDDAVAADAADAIGVVSAAGIRAGLLTPEYVAAVRARELEHPTGLHTSASVGVAVPHATPTEEDQPSSLLVARFATPVPFGEMGAASGSVDVSLVFLLSVPGKDHLGLLGALARLFQDESSMRALLAATTDELTEMVGGTLEAAGIALEGLP